MPSFDFLLARVRLSCDSATAEIVGRDETLTSSSLTTSTTTTTSFADDDATNDDEASSSSSSAAPPSNSDEQEIALDSSTTLAELHERVARAFKLSDAAVANCALSVVPLDGAATRLLAAGVSPYDEHKRMAALKCDFVFVLHRKNVAPVLPPAASPTSSSSSRRRRVRKLRSPLGAATASPVLAASASASGSSSSLSSSPQRQASSRMGASPQRVGNSAPTYTAPTPAALVAAAASLKPASPAPVEPRLAVASSSSSASSSVPSSPATRSKTVFSAVRRSDLSRSASSRDPRVALVGAAVSSTAAAVLAADELSPRPRPRARSFSDLFRHSWSFTSWMVPPIADAAVLNKVRESTSQIKARKRLLRISTKLDTSLAAELQTRFSLLMRDETAGAAAPASPVLSDAGALRGGTFESLCEWLTGDNAVDANSVDAFCLTISRIATPDALLALLQRRYDGTADTSTSKQALIRLRTINVIKRWLTVDAQLFADERLAALVSRFAARIDAERDGLGGDNDWRGHLDELIRESLELVTTTNRTGVRAPDFPYPRPLMPSNVRQELGFLDVPPLEMARQLCLMQHDLFQSISAADLLSPARNRPDETQPASIRRLIQSFNRASYGFASEIVSTGNLDMRVAILERVIEVGQHLLELGNFFGLMAVQCSLSLGAVQRLKQTWSRVRKQRAEQFSEFEQLLTSSNNYGAYRARLAEQPLPVVPFLGVVMNDLVALEELPDRLADDETALNWGKLSSFALVLRTVKRAQLVPYRFEPVFVVSEFLEKMRVMGDAQLFREAKLLEQASERTEAPKKRWWQTIK